MTSGAFTEAYQQLVEQFQKTTRHTVVTTYGASMGGARTRSQFGSIAVSRSMW